MNEAKRNERRLDRPVRLLPTPEDGGRVETGPVQFGDDWPGLFIRGDNAAHDAMLLHAVITNSGNTPETNRLARMMLIGLYNQLRSATIGPAAELMPDIDPADLQPNARNQRRA